MRPTTNPFLAMWDAFFETWNKNLEISAKMRSEMRRAALPPLQPTGEDIHQMLLEVECDELTATKFFLAVIGMAEAAGIYAASIDSTPAELVPVALEALDFQFEPVEMDQSNGKAASLVSAMQSV